jgi:hypothetical protein
MTLAQATQPVVNSSLWTPGEVSMLMTVFATVVIGGFFAGWRSIIALKRDATLAIIAATKAQTTSEHNERRMDGVQQQLTQVALNTPTAIAPVTLEQAQLMRQPPPAAAE